MTADQLVGRWKLVSWLARNGDGEVSYPFGERAEGSLVYTRGGWMSGQLAVSDRDALATNDVVGGDEIERSAAYSSYIAYAGTYEVVGDVVIHRVKMSLFPNWVNTEQRTNVIGFVLDSSSPARTSTSSSEGRTTRS